MSTAAALRWRLAVTIRSLRLVPPLLGLAAYLLLFLAQRGQAWGSVVAADLLAAFVLSLWSALAHTGALSRGHREITEVAVGRRPAYLAELLGAGLIAAAIAVLVVIWPVVLRIADPMPSPIGVLGSLLVVAVAGAAGAATAQLLDVADLRPPARFVAAVGIVAVVLARPAMAAALTWPLPSVMDTAKAVNAHDLSAEAWWATAATATWTVVASVAAYVVTVRFPRSSARG